MPGTKNSGRPGGNPDLIKYAFKTDRDEPLREKVNLRVSKSMLEKLKEKENWHEFIRQAIARALEEEAQAS